MRTCFACVLLAIGIGSIQAAPPTWAIELPHSDGMIYSSSWGTSRFEAIVQAAVDIAFVDESTFLSITRGDYRETHTSATWRTPYVSLWAQYDEYELPKTTRTSQRVILVIFEEPGGNATVFEGEYHGERPERRTSSWTINGEAEPGDAISAIIRAFEPVDGFDPPITFEETVLDSDPADPIWYALLSAPSRE